MSTEETTEKELSFEEWKAKQPPTDPNRFAYGEEGSRRFADWLLSKVQTDSEWAQLQKVRSEHRPEYDHNKIYSKDEADQLFWLDKLYALERLGIENRRKRQEAKEKATMESITPKEFANSLEVGVPIEKPEHLNAVSVQNAARATGFRVSIATKNGKMWLLRKE